MRITKNLGIFGLVLSAMAAPSLSEATSSISWEYDGCSGFFNAFKIFTQYGGSSTRNYYFLSFKVVLSNPYSYYAGSWTEDKQGTYVGSGGEKTQFFFAGRGCDNDNYTTCTNKIETSYLEVPLEACSEGD